MQKETLAGAVIHYINGEKEGFVFTRDDLTEEGQQAVVERMQHAMQSNALIFKTTSDRLIVIPIQNIQKIEINPAPPKLPDTVFENVRVVQDWK